MRRAQEVAAPRQWAVLIGIEKYQKARPLQYTNNDVQVLSETLVSRGGFERNCVSELIDNARKPFLQPTKKNLVDQLPRLLLEPGPADRVILYFSGHGVRDAEGKLYLVPIDGDPADPDGTMIPLDWLKQQFERCQATFKLLILDACHAGSEKGEDRPRQIPIEEIDRLFKDVPGVITLASSTATETSQIWPEKRQSLFSFWLNQGLKGHADLGADGIVDIDELYNFVHSHVTRTAKVVFKQEQNPVRIIRTGVGGSPMVVKLVPQSLKRLMADMAEQLAQAAQEQKLLTIGVLPEFISQGSGGDFLGADFGLLGKDCARDLERQLSALGHGEFAFDVIDGRSLQAAIHNQKYAIGDTGSPDRRKGLAKEVNGMAALTEGIFRGRAGRVLSVLCRLIKTESGSLAASVGGTACLTPEEWAMLGKSAVFTADLQRPPAPGTPDGSRPIEDVVIDRLDDLSKGQHPLQNPGFPYKVRVKVGGREHAGVFKGNDYYVPVGLDDEYEIEVENPTSNLVCMRLLVDGLNTLPEKEPDAQELPPDAINPPKPPSPTPAVSHAKAIRTLGVARRVSLGEARHYILDPKRSKVYAVRGFATETGKEGGYLTFKVVEASKALAARQQFTDQIGLITVALFEPILNHKPVSKPRGVIGTDTGDFKPADIPEVADIDCGKPIAVIHIHYVDPEEFKKIGR